ncbi:MAG: hypothetical protein AAF386_11135 [Pseudomonadota bacterium]
MNKYPFGFGIVLFGGLALVAAILQHWILFACYVACVGAFVWGWHTSRAKVLSDHTARDSVSWDGAVLTLDLGQTRTTVALADITHIGIHTNDLGPFVCDMVWIIDTAAGRNCVGSDVDGIDVLFDMLHHLDGVDYQAITRASMSIENASFPIRDKELCSPPKAKKPTAS